jgi:hypothetical protein
MTKRYYPGVKWSKLFPKVAYDKAFNEERADGEGGMLRRVTLAGSKPTTKNLRTIETALKEAGFKVVEVFAHSSIVFVIKDYRVNRKVREWLVGG